ncbi:hypothetical protein A4D02_35235 [Niastella koreensis]|uniref:TonB family protein n=2 Tax=Niastella koreensis TaxID=354356 RepID=G8TBS0_NIAKG|nr:hypothetical protein [Niastella koreensis]AEV98202.1 hypothetical protein Niako_1843 [Niastella koreensis GR20-10]OQP44312.1 hypothetical protein A4D02_35235 [Niastella koreensis]
MKFVLLTGLLLIAGGIACAQHISNETYLVCDDKVFDQVEILPDFKNGKAAFEDSLTQALKRKNNYPAKGTITYGFVLTMQSQLVDVKAVKGVAPNDEAIKKALKATAGNWIPAKQNSHTVCAYVYLTLNFSTDRLETSLFQKRGEE